jgi:hypothetical protein
MPFNENCKILLLKMQVHSLLLGKRGIPAHQHTNEGCLASAIFSKHYNDLGVCKFPLLNTELKATLCLGH